MNVSLIPLRLFRALLLFACAWISAVGAAVDIQFVTVGDAGNPFDPASNPSVPGIGSVPYPFRIAKYDVTNTQYAEFLNAKASSDTLGLYDGRMDSDALFGGITRTGNDGSFTYAVKPGFENKPVVFISFFDGLRFANWLNNGQAAGDTETGAYTLIGGTPSPQNASTVTRNVGASVFLPNENEWYKAAYYQGDGTYTVFATSSNVLPTAEPPPGANNSANLSGAFNGGSLTDVGAYTASKSHYVVFDQTGNVWNWDETITSGGYRGLRGGSYSNGQTGIQSIDRLSVEPGFAFSSFGLRIAAYIPTLEVTPPTRQTWRILPLGDSITQSTLPHLSYRYNLWVKLIDSGFAFDFVGSLIDNAGSGGSNPGNWPLYKNVFDQNHEGHSGNRTDEILASLSGWMQGYTPDIVLLHIGTNDVLQSRQTQLAVTDIKAIIDTLRAKNPSIIVLLAKILPITPSDPHAPLISQLNMAISGIVSEKNTPDSRVIAVDQNTGFDVATDTYDGVHPNATGEEKMAKKWFDALQLFTLKATPGFDDERHLTLSYLRVKGASELTYEVQVSSDFVSWISGPSATEDVSVIDNQNGTERVVTRDRESAATQSLRFIRLRLNYAQ